MKNEHAEGRISTRDYKGRKEGVIGIKSFKYIGTS